MTREEAINILKTNAINATGTLGGLPPTAAEKSRLNRQIEALDMAIAALEKQIPKKPVKLNCPRCRFNGIDNSWWVFTYCPECGQAIDWSEEE